MITLPGKYLLLSCSFMLKNGETACIREIVPYVNDSVTISLDFTITLEPEGQSGYEWDDSSGVMAINASYPSSDYGVAYPAQEIKLGNVNGKDFHLAYTLTSGVPHVCVSLFVTIDE